MKFRCHTIFTVGAALAQTVTGFDINSKNHLALYWGQASAGSQQSLGDYCDQTSGDIYILSFMNDFSSNSFGLNFAGNCDSTESCPNIGEDIQKCQSLGKIVLLSLGGAVGQYGLGSDSNGEELATLLWNNFAGGTSSSRPFGDAQVDGFDLDIENNAPTGYAAMVNKLRQYYNGADKQYYVSAAPQCVYPDANVGDALANSDIDMAFIQFYNNPCALDKTFNWDTWQNFAETASPNKNIKLFIGLPGSSSAAGSGYVDPSIVQSTVNSVSGSANFGGIMVWDASQAFSNNIGGSIFAGEMQNILNGVSGQSSSSTDSSGAILSLSLGLGPNTAATTAAATAVASVTQSPGIAASSPAAVHFLAAQPSASSLDSSTVITLTTVVTQQLQPTTITITSSPQPTQPIITGLTQSPSQQPQVSSTIVETPQSTGICVTGETKCTDGKYTVCDNNNWISFNCPLGTVCLVLNNTPQCGFAKRDYIPPIVRRHTH